MRELRPQAVSGPFTTAVPGQGLIPANQPRLPAQRGLGGRALLWTQLALSGVGLITIGAFIIGVTPIPEKIGEVTGRIAAATISEQTLSQIGLQGGIAEAQQQARLSVDMELQFLQAALQSDLAALNAALEGVKNILIQKATADLQARNIIVEKNAQLQTDRVRQITQIQAQLEQGNITSAQVADMLKNVMEGFGADASNLRRQSDSIKAEVMDSVTRVTPMDPENSAGLMEQLGPDSMLDADIQTALAEIERRVADIQRRFAVRTVPPRQAYGGRQ